MRGHSSTCGRTSAQSEGVGRDREMRDRRNKKRKIDEDRQEQQNLK